MEAYRDLTTLAGTSTTAAGASALTSFGLSAGNPGHVQYLAGNGHINHLFWNGSAWQNQDLTAIATYATTVFDSGLVTLNVGSFAAAACFGTSTNPSCTGQSVNSTVSQVTMALANAINVTASPATATVNGTTLNLTWKTPGNVTTGVSALTTTHDQPSVFTSPSFTSSATNFSGGGAPGAPVTVFSLNYDFHVHNGDNGNVWAITNNKDSQRSQTFTYDALNRLILAQNAGTDCGATALNGKAKFWGNSYGYDAWGNLLQKTETKCTAEHLSVLALGNNQLSGYGYDAAGNMTSDPTDSVIPSYDPENRIATVTQNRITTSYVYDYEGNRVKKSNGSNGTLYWYMSMGIVAESDLSGNLQSEYLFFNGDRVARRDFPSGAVSYYFSDHLKTTDIVTDAQGNVKNDSDYYPWGGEVQFAANDSNHYKFTGKERDTETGLDYFGARYYSNGLGRWITADWSTSPVPVPYADFSDPQSLNQYSYVRNLPTTKIDGDGHGLFNAIRCFFGSSDACKAQADERAKHEREEKEALHRKAEEARKTLAQMDLLYHGQTMQEFLSQATDQEVLDAQQAFVMQLAENYNWWNWARNNGIPSAGVILPAGMSNSDFGQKVMKWGTGDDAARARISTLTREELEQNGVTKEIAESWRDFYKKVKADNPANPSAQGRMELMQKAVELLGGK